MALTIPEQDSLVQALSDFSNYAERYWLLADKTGRFVPFVPNRAQQLVLDAAARQIAKFGFVRLNVLKGRQLGISTLVTALGLHYSMTRVGRSALSIAHELKLPATWLRRCKAWRDRVHEKWPEICPKIGSTQANELFFDSISTRYYIGSAQGGFPGMGDTIHFLHLSELGRWDKSPLSLDPDAVLRPLAPAIPTGAYGKGTWIIRESTGVMRGDWWYRAWQAGKEDSEYENVFLPWFLADEYCREDLIDTITELSEYEMNLFAIAEKYDVTLTKGHIAWRRRQLHDEFQGDEDTFKAEYPATEEEAFMSPGRQVFSNDQTDKARTTVREPIWTGDILSERDPARFVLDESNGGDLLIWSKPNPKFHYVIGADCRWGKGDESDWDVLHVECLETRKLCARVRCKRDLVAWAKIIASVGYYYNTAVLAPERNALAASILMPILLGNVGEWKYPNIWIRSNDVKLRGWRPEDYGWLTDINSKGDLVAFAKQGTIEGCFDWCDSLAVDEAEAWIHDEKTGNPTHPTGAHDDCLMSRLITAYVSHRERQHGNMYVEPITKHPRFTSMEERVGAMLYGVNDEQG